MDDKTIAYPEPMKSPTRISEPLTEEVFAWIGPWDCDPLPDAAPGDHVDDVTLRAFVEGHGSFDEVALLDHLDACDECADRCAAAAAERWGTLS